LGSSSDQGLRFGTPQARWVLIATVLGSGIAFLDGTVVNVALPAIRNDLGSSTAGLQWIIDGYLVGLTALLLFGGSLGDLLGRRRVFLGGLIGFACASTLCGISPNTATLIAARIVQGAAAAFLVPGSLAILSAAFHPADRSRAVGAWSGLAGVASAVGPFLGGWLIDAASWRLVFFINIPLTAAAVWVTVRHVPETRDPSAGRPDIAGAVAVTVGLAGATYALIEGPGGLTPLVVIVAGIGVAALVGFVVIERRSRAPMLPLEVFRSRQFTGANLTTFAVYAALGGAMFLLTLQLQISMGYSALEAGVSLLPLTVVMMLFSSRSGALAQRIGPRTQMTVGPVIAGIGVLLLVRVRPGAHYWTEVFPAVLVFAVGMTVTVAPLTSAVLAAVERRHVGVGSGVNNAVARLASLVAVAVLPAVAGIDTGDAPSIDKGFATAMVISGVTAVAGGAIAFVTIRRGTAVEPTVQPAIIESCLDPCRSSGIDAEEAA
jgi:EmrB/QacA subfamily drug resistance transporter